MQRLGVHLNPAAASTYQALDKVPGPVLSALQTLCHLILTSTCDPEPSVMPILSRFPARAPDRPQLTTPGATLRHKN